MKDQGMTPPREADSNRLLRAAEYWEGLVSLIQKRLIAPNEARYLPVSMETEQFGKEEESDRFPRLRSAWHNGHGLTALVKGFAIASLGVDASLLIPLQVRLTAQVVAERDCKKPETASSSGQTELNIKSS